MGDARSTVENSGAGRSGGGATEGLNALSGFTFRVGKIGLPKDEKLLAALAALADMPESAPIALRGPNTENCDSGSVASDSPAA